jgi:hypothetical protein
MIHVRALADGKSAGGVEQPGNERAAGQVVVDPYRFAGLGHVHRDGTLIQVAAGIWANGLLNGYERAA